MDISPNIRPTKDGTLRIESSPDLEKNERKNAQLQHQLLEATLEIGRPSEYSTDVAQEQGSKQTVSDPPRTLDE